MYSICQPLPHMKQNKTVIVTRDIVTSKWKTYFCFLWLGNTTIFSFLVWNVSCPTCSESNWPQFWDMEFWLFSLPLCQHSVISSLVWVGRENYNPVAMPHHCSHVLVLQFSRPTAPNFQLLGLLNYFGQFFLPGQAILQAYDFLSRSIFFNLVDMNKLSE
jgi:hypothetical protein